MRTVDTLRLGISNLAFVIVLSLKRETGMMMASLARVPRKMQMEKCVNTHDPLNEQASRGMAISLLVEHIS